MFAAVCDLDAPYKSGPSKAWIKVKNPKAPAVTRAKDGTF
jgi:ATP-dependent DNA ligase